MKFIAFAITLAIYGCASAPVSPNTCYTLQGAPIDTTKIAYPVHVICNDSLVVVGVSGKPKTLIEEPHGN